MSGNRSIQETNILREVKNFISSTGGPISIKGKNGFVIKDVSNIGEDPLGDKSAADLIITTSSGSSYKISCKQYNPINFAGAGLKSFVDDIEMKSWMNKALRKVAEQLNAYYTPQKNKIMNKIGDYLIKDIQKNTIDSPLDNITQNNIKAEYDKLKSIIIPDIYIKIPDSMRLQIFTASNVGGPISYYILNGNANSISKDTTSKTITINDCDILSTSNMVKKGETLYLVIRKRRADQFFSIWDSTGRNPLKSKDGFLRIFSKSLSKGDIGARVQIREKQQLPKILKQAISDGTKTKTLNATNPASSIILEVD
jgi:hypothetical protein